MRLLALDLGRRMGVADGDSKVPPRVEAVILRGVSVESRALYLGDWLHERLNLNRLADMVNGNSISLIVTESPMNPAASKSAAATVDQLYYHGCLQGVAAVFRIPVETAPVKAVRKHFCGVASAPRITGRKRTAAEARAARTFINEAVLNRAILLGYLPAGSKGWDEANACALFEFGCAKFARGRPETLVMFGTSA